MRSYTYLDYAASAPLRPQAHDAYEEYLQSAFAAGNPNSLHSHGRMAAHALEDARSGIAELVDPHLRPSEIFFTSGGTESNNLAIFGLAQGMRKYDPKKNQVIVSAIEHESVLSCISELRALSFEVATLNPNRQGQITKEALQELLSDRVALVSIMSANNETGIIQDIADLAEVTHRSGALFHSDAVQSFCHVALDVSQLDAASFAAHKFGGPRGIGCLLLKNRTPFVTRSFGGGQESGRRSGTQDVASAVAMHAAARFCIEHLDENTQITERLAQSFYEEVLGQDSVFVPTVSLDSSIERLSTTISIMASGFESESIILRLDDSGYAISAGSACASASLEPSHVLRAMGIEKDQAFGALRISFDERVSEAELLGCARTLKELCRSL